MFLQQNLNLIIGVLVLIVLIIILAVVIAFNGNNDGTSGNGGDGWNNESSVLDHMNDCHHQVSSQDGQDNCEHQSHKSIHRSEKHKSPRYGRRSYPN